MYKVSVQLDKALGTLLNLQVVMLPCTSDRTNKLEDLIVFSLVVIR